MHDGSASRQVLSPYRKRGGHRPPSPSSTGPLKLALTIAIIPLLVRRRLNRLSRMAHGMHFTPATTPPPESCRCRIVAILVVKHPVQMASARSNSMLLVTNRL